MSPSRLPRFSRLCSSSPSGQSCSRYHSGCGLAADPAGCKSIGKLYRDGLKWSNFEIGLDLKPPLIRDFDDDAIHSRPSGDRHSRPRRIMENICGKKATDIGNELTRSVPLKGKKPWKRTEVGTKQTAHLKFNWKVFFVHAMAATRSLPSLALISNGIDFVRTDTKDIIVVHGVLSQRWSHRSKLMCRRVKTYKKRTSMIKMSKWFIEDERCEVTAQVSMCWMSRGR